MVRAMTGASSAGPQEGTRPNLPEFTVSELSQALKRSIEERFSYVRVRGEISGWKRHASGHCYFALKDIDAVIDAVCWRQTAIRLQVKPEDGMEVVVTGRLTTYPGRSKYQIVVDAVELAGIGALLKMLEERKQRLAAEGLFAPERKKKLPFLPNVIGVVTSPTGAVIRDILHRLSDRFPRRVLLWPVAVQGEGAAAQIAAAIEGFNALPPGGPVPRPDLLIVARGGGSIEDLMPFNEEIVVRAAAASAIPLISAVGHETDTTLIDFAADRRAPTPTAAAEMAVPVRLELLAETAAKGGRLTDALRRYFEGLRLRLDALRRGLPDPQSLIGLAQQRLDDRAERLVVALAALVDRRRHQLAACAGRLSDPRQALRQRRERVAELGHRLDAAIPVLLHRWAERAAGLAARIETHRRSHEQVLERGYAVVRNAAGIPVTSAQAVAPGVLTIEFHDGEVSVNAGGKRRGKKEAPEQPKLL
ncbi:MAG: exodeoxyribonuclease VII large subunit [Rhodospirillales bacterium]|nr:exodeoxyribonuclease VII large subunit [Rhodospirillales bacterium]